MLTIERLEGRKLPTDLRADWNRLAGDIPFRRWEWLANWWNQYHDETELYVLLARDDAGVIRGIAPWRIRKSVASGRTIEPLGSGKASSDYLSLLCEAGDESRVAIAIANWLDNANKSSRKSFGDAWDLLHLTGSVNDDAAVTELTSRLTAHGSTAHERPGLRTWRVSLVGGWEAYLGSLSKSARRQARRSMKVFRDEVAINYFEVTDEATLDRGFTFLVELHQRRWEHLGFAGCFSDDRFTRFLRDACRDFFALGKLHLSWLEYDGKPFVASVAFDGGEIDYVYQGGMDPNSRDLSPGWMHMVHLVQRSMALGKTHRDYLRGDEPYKKHWRGKPTQLVDLRIVPPHVAARLRHGVWMIGDSLKHWVKQRLRGTPIATEFSGREAEAPENC